MTRRIYFLLALIVCASLNLFFFLRPGSTEPAPAPVTINVGQILYKTE